MKMKKLIACMCAASMLLGVAAPVTAKNSTTTNDTVVNAKENNDGKVFIVMNEEAKQAFKELIADKLSAKGATEEEIQQVTAKAFNTVDALSAIMNESVPVAQEDLAKTAVSFDEVVKKFTEDESLSTEDLGVDSTAAAQEIKVTKANGQSVMIPVENLEFKSDFLAFGAAKDNQVSANKAAIDPLAKTPVNMELSVDANGNVNDSLGLTDPQTIVGQFNPETGVAEYFRLSDYVEANNAGNVVKVTVKAFPYENALVTFVGAKEGVKLDTLVE